MNLLALFSDRRGSVMITTGLAIVFLVGIAGAAIDLGQQQLLRARTQQASDAAALAAAGLASKGDPQQIALRYFNLNFSQSYMGVQRPMPAINVGPSTISVTASNTLKNNFVNNIGLNSVSAGGKTTVAIASEEKSAALDFDVAAVIDESGSTGARSTSGRTRMDEEKDALRDMIDSVLSSSEDGDSNRRFGVVGYSGAITTIGPLTSKAGNAKSYIAKLKPRCQNYDHYGIEGGVNMLNGGNGGGLENTGYCAVQKNTTMPAPATARDDGQLVSKVKHLVFITDGYIMVEPPCTRGKCPNYDIFLDACDKAKSSGVNVYTISFVSQTPGDVTALKACASNDPKTGQPQYYFAPDAATLRSILAGVVQTIKSIRITE